MPVMNVGVVGPVNGMNEPELAGSYLRLVVYRGDNDDRQEFMISRGAAEVLAAEIVGTLAKK